MKNLDLVFHIPGVSCQNCAHAIQKKLKPHSFINSIHIDLGQKQLQLSIDVDDETTDMTTKIRELLGEIGFEANLVSKKIAQDNTHLMGATIGLSLGLFFMLSSLGVFGFAFMTAWPFILGSNLLLIYLAFPFARNAWQRFLAGLRQYPDAQFLNMDSLFVLTGLIVVASSLLSVVFPIFSNPLQAGFLIFGFRHLGCMVQAFLHQKMGMSDSLIGALQNKTYRLSSGALISARDLKPGMEIVLIKGDVLPVNARIKQKTENVEIKHTLHDGGYFSKPVEDIPDELEAGVELSQGKLVVEVQTTLEGSRLGLIDKSINNMRQEHSHLLNKVNRALQWFIPLILLLALASGLLVAHFFNIALAIKCVTSVLVSACPCTLGLIIPMAVRIGAFRAGQEKVLFQNAEALEAAAQADTFVLDYNGTLTTGIPQFEPFVHEDEALSRHDCLVYIRAMEEKIIEKRGEQRLARAIITQVTRELEESAALPEGDFVDEIYKCQLTTEQGRFFLGNNQLLKQFPNMDKYYQAQSVHLLWEKTTGEICYLGYMLEQDNLRADAKSFIHALQKKGKTVTICTGADVNTAEKIARELSFSTTDIKANCRVEDKLTYIQKLKAQKRKVVMIGDAINDKAALEGSDLGIWFKSERLPKSWGDDVLGHSAHMVVYSDSLMSILKGVDIASQTYQVIYQNLAFSLLYNLISLSLACGVLLSFGISLPPALGVALMILQSAFLGVNTWHGLSQKNDEAESDLSRNALAAT